jgi:uncharacterized protein (TIGR03435 family)
VEQAFSLPGLLPPAAKLKEAAPVNRPRPPLHGDNWWEFARADVAHLADVLAQNVHAPVEDQTGLKGFYTITFRIAASDRPDDAERAARFDEALSNLGLRLAASKVQAPILVFDSASKTPTTN